MDAAIHIATPRVVANISMFSIAPESKVVLMNKSVTVAPWKIDAVPDTMEIDPRSGVLVPEQAEQLTVRFMDLAMKHCMVVVFVEGGSPLLLEFSGPDG